MQVAVDGEGKRRRKEKVDGDERWMSSDKEGRKEGW
jgi:hypothetical protein